MSGMDYGRDILCHLGMNDVMSDRRITKIIFKYHWYDDDGKLVNDIIVADGRIGWFVGWDKTINDEDGDLFIYFRNHNVPIAIHFDEKDISHLKLYSNWLHARIEGRGYEFDGLEGYYTLQVTFAMPEDDPSKGLPVDSKIYKNYRFV
jgi:hypothetical protein